MSTLFTLPQVKKDFTRGNRDHELTFLARAFQQYYVVMEGAPQFFQASGCGNSTLFFTGM